MIQSTRTRTASRADDTDPSVAPFTVSTSRRYQRRPALIGLGLGLLAVCGAGSAYLARLSGDADQVLAVAHDVARGEVIEDGDLTVAMAAPDPALDPMPAIKRAEVVGRRAAADLVSGSLLTPGAVTTGDLPGAGQTIVGVAVTETQLPREPMLPGDNVRVFDTPNPGDKPPKDTPAFIRATVVSVSGPTESGSTIVDVVVDADTAGALAARVATGRIAIVLDSVEKGTEAAAEASRTEEPAQ